MFGYYGSYDVIVCGGGTSGITAAVAAARTGAKTLLIERVGQLGGQMNFSGPPGFSFAHLFNGRHEQIIAGFAEETHKILLDEGHAWPHNLQPHRGNYTFSYVDPDWWGLLVYKLLEEAGAELMLHSLVTEVIKEDNIVKGVVCEHPGGKSIVLGKVVIDCTGEGEVCYQAGAEYEIAPKSILEPATVAFTADGVNWDEVVKYIHEHIDDMIFNQLHNPYNEWSDDKIRKRVLELNDIRDIGEVMGYLSLKRHATWTGEWHNMSGVGFFIMPKGDKILAHFQHSSQLDQVDCTDVRDITKVEIECRRQNMMAWRFFKKYVPGFENAYITRTCPETRIRETRRIMGDYVLKREDIAEGKKFPDVIGKSAFPTGAKHAVNGRALALEKSEQVKDLGSNDIPYRVLVVKGLENLLVAGKAVSADRASHQRFLQQTIVTGQAAGTAAALCAKEGITPREMEADVTELQNNLRKQGVILEGVH